MARRLPSDGLQHLKFMQRARQKEELAARVNEEEPAINENHWIVPADKSRFSQNKCVVIMEGDPKPGALLGRMSFQNFNSDVDKLAEEAELLNKRRLYTPKERAEANLVVTADTKQGVRVNEEAQVQAKIDNMETNSPGKGWQRKKPKVEPNKDLTEQVSRPELGNRARNNFKAWPGWRDGGDYRVLRPSGSR
eukprot:c9351_g1_i1 orf=122-700(+)